MEGGFVAHFERKVLFRIARIVAFSFCFILFLSLLGGAAYLLTTGEEPAQPPDASALAQELKPAPASTSPQDAQATVGPTKSAPLPAALRGVRLPPTLQELFLDEQNQQVLSNWLEELPVEERQAFLDGLAKAVEEARKAGVEDSDAMNLYRERFVEYLAQKTAEEAKVRAERTYIVGALVSTLVLIALFSLVLVMLAIERNTRPLVSQGSAK